MSYYLLDSHANISHEIFQFMSLTIERQTSRAIEWRRTLHDRIFFSDHLTDVTILSAVLRRNT